MHAHTQARTRAGSTAAHNLRVEIDGAAALARALLVGGLVPCAARSLGLAGMGEGHLNERVVPLIAQHLRGMAETRSRDRGAAAKPAR